MLDLFGPRWHLGCSRSALALLRRDRFGHHAGVPIERGWPIEADPVLQLAQQLHSALDEARCTGARLTLVLSDDWCTLGVMASRRAPSAAVPVALETALQEIVAQYRLRGVVLQSHCLAAWERWHVALKKTDWFGLLHDSRLTLIARHAGTLVALTQHVLTQDDMKHPDWIDALVRAEAPRLDVPAPSRLVLCGEVPQPWLVEATGRLPCIWLQDKKLPAGSLAVALAQAGIPA